MQTTRLKTFFANTNKEGAALYKPCSYELVDLTEEFVRAAMETIKCLKERYSQRWDELLGKRRRDLGDGN